MFYWTQVYQRTDVIVNALEEPQWGSGNILASHLSRSGLNPRPYVEKLVVA